MQPIGNPPNPLGGPYAELNGDACGDIEKAQPTYKDLVLDDLLCQDEDGDGNVDASYVLSWVNNSNQANCTNPLDPAQFLPNPPKCRADLSYDLPIGVEQPPSIDVSKNAIPNRLYAPGGDVNYQVTIVNTSPSVSDPVTITSIVDQIDGQPPVDVSGQTDCTLPLTLSPGQLETCTFVVNVKGRAGETVTDTVTVRGTDDEGEPVGDSADATVAIISTDAPAPPGELSLRKFAFPGELDEPGGLVQYAVLVTNLSQTGVNLTALDDDLYGDLDGQGSCSVPQFIGGANPVYYCSFSAPVTGQPGDVVTDTITASGTDVSASGNLVIAQDSASVEIVDVPSAIEVSKIAYPDTVQAPGDNVTFELRVQNLSVTDSVTINTLLDSQLGVPNGNCNTGFTLAPGEIYQCTYTGLVTGDPGDTVTNIVTAGGRDDDGGLVFGLSAASVEVAGTGPALRVFKVAVPSTVPTTGGNVAYAVAIQNVSGNGEVITVNELVDEVDGAVTPLDGVGNCDLTNLILQPAPSQDSYYFCRFAQALPAGQPGATVTDTVTARGADGDGTPVEGSDSATVTYDDTVPPDVPTLTVLKAASPEEVPEPGDDVTFSIFLANASSPGDTNLQLTVQSLDDDIYADLFLKGDCGNLQGLDLAPGESAACSFTETVTGAVGDIHTNTVTATAIDASSRPAVASDSASVTVVDVPSSIEVVKTANPVTVREPGGDVTFDITVYNTSSVDVVRLFELNDSVHGNLLTSGLCPPPPILFPGRDPYRCSFTAEVSGSGGYEERNTVIASGTDDDNVAVEASDEASVTVIDRPPAISITKQAQPKQVFASGEPVTFTIIVSNDSASDAITLDALVDSVYGDLDGQGDCAVPQSMPATTTYQCSFEAVVAGTAGETHLNEVTASGTSDDGDPVAATAVATVDLLDDSRAVYVDVPIFGKLGLALLALLLGWVGYARLRVS